MSRLPYTIAITIYRVVVALAIIITVGAIDTLVQGI